MLQKVPYFLGLDLNIDSPSRTVTAGLTLCEQMPLDELLAQLDTDQNSSDAHNQMNLFD